MLQGLMNPDALMLSDISSVAKSAWNIAQIILGFSLIVFVHELGHFLAAKWAGVRVERFAVGFGRELVGFTRGETRYSFNVLPLGGYVKMLGQEDFVVDKTGELKVKEDPRSFTNKSVAKRMVIVCAGVVMNLIFAAVAFTIVAMVGRHKPPAVLGYVDQNMPAGRAGLQAGDRILEVNGDPVTDFPQLFSLISLADEGDELVLTVERDGKIVEPAPRVIPEYQKDNQRQQIGVGPGWIFRVRSVDNLAEPASPDSEYLQPNDLVTHVIVDGKREPVGTGTTFVRACYAAQGQPISLIVQRPTDTSTASNQELLDPQADVPSVEKQVTFRPIWAPLPFDSDAQDGSLLGLVPRLSVWGLLPGKAFAKAGLQSMDVITRIGGIEFPNAAELRAEYESHAGRTLKLEVRRAHTGQHGLSADSVDWLVMHREPLVVAALRDGIRAAQETASGLIEKSPLANVERESLIERLAALTAVDAWQQWLDRVDIHALEIEVPRAGWFGSSPPTVDASFQNLDEGVVFVADVKASVGGRPTPAQTAGIPRFAVIESIDDIPVQNWNDLFNVLNRQSGRTVRVAYRHFDQLRTTTMNVPQSIRSAFGMVFGDRFTKIADRASAEIITGKDADGKDVTRKAILPDWRATRAILADNVDTTVPVEYARLSGETGSGQFAVTSENLDPWQARIQYLLPLGFDFQMERHPITNPIDAFVAGIRDAYQATVDTVLTIKQMISQNVGVKNVSGPLGIMHYGSQVAEKGLIDLLWLLALLSANLAVINFLPLPIVDGGLFLFLVLEKIRGEPVSIKVQVATQIIGIALIATIFILVTAQDLFKLMS